MKNFSSKTKENYLHNSKRLFEWKYLVWIFIAILIVYGGKSIISGISSFVISPVYLARHYIETSSATIPVFIRSRLELLATIQDLELEIATQNGRDASFAYIAHENEELRRLLNASSSPRILAGVISRPPHTPYDTLILDRGADDGIVKDAPVYQGADIAIGYVREVFGGTALVTLFSSPNVESTVYIFGPNIFSTAYGEGGGVIRLSVPQGVMLEKGNVVILPSLDAGTLGVIADIQSIPTEPEQHAYVTFDIPLQSMRVVSVGTSPLTPVTYTEAQAHVAEKERTLFTFEVPETVHGGIPTVPTTSSSSRIAP